MHRITIILISLLIYNNTFAQENKHCLFIGLYDKAKRGICSDRAMLQISVKDYAEYNLISAKFKEEHSSENPSIKFISEQESVIAYEYEKAISGWGCNSKVISMKIGKSIDECKQQLTEQQTKYPKDFTTQPNIIFTWQGIATIQKQTITEDFGGVAGKFFIVNKTDGGGFIVAQLSNKTTDQLAIILLKTDDGKMLQEFLYPGETLTKKYDTKKMEIQVSYQDSQKPKPSFSLIEFIKTEVRSIIIQENGNLKSSTWDPTCMCVRG